MFETWGYKYMIYFNKVLNGGSKILSGGKVWFNGYEVLLCKMFRALLYNVMTTVNNT